MRQASLRLLSAVLILLAVPALAGASGLAMAPPSGAVPAIAGATASQPASDQVLAAPLAVPGAASALEMRDKNTIDRAFIAKQHKQLGEMSCAVAMPAAMEAVGSLFEPSAALTSCCTPTLVLICQREGLRCGFDDLGNCGCQLNGPR